MPTTGPGQRWRRRSLGLARPLGAVGGELLQQRRELSLDLDDLVGLVQLTGQPLVLFAQGQDFSVPGIGRGAARRLSQGF